MSRIKASPGSKFKRSTDLWTKYLPTQNSPLTVKSKTSFNNPFPSPGLVPVDLPPQLPPYLPLSNPPIPRLPLDQYLSLDHLLLSPKWSLYLDQVTTV